MDIRNHILVLFVALNAQVLAQSSTNTISSLASISTAPITSSRLACSETYSTGQCQVATYIQHSCLNVYNDIDDLWGCYCSNGYDKAWSSCNSCQNQLNITKYNVDSTNPYIARCSSILSVLSSVRATADITTSSTDSTSIAMTALPGGTSSAQTTSGTSRNEAARDIFQVTSARLLPVLWAWYLLAL